MSRPCSINKHKDFILANAGRLLIREIAAELDINRNTVMRFGKELGISFRQEAQVKECEMIEQIIRDNQDKTVREILKLTGIKRSKLLYRASKIGIKLTTTTGRHRNKRAGKEGFFNEMERDWLI